MRLKISKSKNAASLYVIKSVYNPKTKSNSSKIVEKLGTEAQLREKLNGGDPYEWAKKYVEDLTKQEKEQCREVMIRCSPAKIINKDEQHSFNGGYLFIQQIYHQLGLHKLCQQISEKCKFEFDLDSILSRLIYSRFMFPASKKATLELSKRFMEQPNFEIQHIYRALEVLAKESDFIQATLYNRSQAICKRNTKILYYDCTNYFFEIEQESGLKQYGVSKEHRPNPIVQMGLFMDGDGMPLAFCLNKGNENEQPTLKPFEQKIISDFGCSKFVVCTDPGLSSTDNRKFNSVNGRAFITTQSIKKLKKHLKEWALEPTGWHLDETSKTYDITNLDEEKYKGSTFYKQRWIKEDGLEQKLIVTYSIKYRDYQRKIRNAQIERATKLIGTNPAKLKTARQNDYKRFIEKTNVTADGEVAGKEIYSIDENLVEQEKAFDGFYGVCTNLEDDPPAIIAVNHRRWEIEECFRIMKHEFKARPVYLSRDDRISAHFMTCFISLLIYRILEKKLDEKFTCQQIIDGLRSMNFHQIQGEGYIPSYTRTNFTDALHEVFGFRTDYQIMTSTQMKKIFKETKK